MVANRTHCGAYRNINFSKWTPHPMKQPFWNTLKSTYHIQVRMWIRLSKIQTILKEDFLTLCKDVFLLIQYKNDSETDVTKQSFYLQFDHVKFQAGNIFYFWDKCLNELPMPVTITCWSEELSTWDSSLSLYLGFLLILMYLPIRSALLACWMIFQDCQLL